ncbi:MAG: Na+/H+ antiporter subunit E [Verrucomicrobiota bacterium]
MKALLSSFRKLPAFLDFAFFYLKEVIASNVRVAHDVITPRHRMRPALIELDTSELTTRQILVLANLISMTPGSLSLDVSQDSKTLLVHAMYVDDEDHLKKDIKDNFMRKVQRVF